jgi:hypothetical protein
MVTTHKAIGELPLEDHCQFEANQRKIKREGKRGFLNPSHEINLIYELMMNWLISLGGKAQLMS